MNDPVKRTIEMMDKNADDLNVLGLLFLRLLQADFNVMSIRPSATLATVLSLEQEGKIGLKKELTTLFRELEATGAPMLTDGFGGSILRS